MVEFINQFDVQKTPDRLSSYDLSYDAMFNGQSNFAYKASSQLSRKLSEEMQVPIASLGSRVICAIDTILPPTANVTMKIDGVPTEVVMTISKAGEIARADREYIDATRRFLNRQIDVILAMQRFRQEGRGFYEMVSKDTGGFRMHEGINVAAQVNEGRFSLVVDPSTQIRSRFTLLDMLNEELGKRGAKHWRDAGEDSEAINRTMRGRAYSLRSTYVEPHRDEPRHNVYKFVGFRFDKSVSDSQDPRSPVQFHGRFGRPVKPDQPVVEVIAQDGRKVDQVPELLEVLPTPKILKRYGMSEKAHYRSLKDANTRFYMTSTLLRPLAEVGLVGSEPVQVGTEEFGPVRLTVRGTYVTIEKNTDFQDLFKKKRLLEPPQINSIIVVSSQRDSGEAKTLTVELLKVFTDFKIGIPKVVERLDGPDELGNFYKYASENLTELQPGRADLALVVFGFEDEDLEDVTYNNIKRDSLRNLFPVQFVNTDTIRDAEESGGLRKGVANPLFLQIVAKCGGRPYGLQPGFVPAGTVFVGVDKYHQSFRRDSLDVMSVTLFDSEGSYVGGSSDVIEYAKPHALLLERLLGECYKAYKDHFDRDASSFIFMIDTGVGTIYDEIRDYIDVCVSMAEKVGASHVFVSSNKNSHLRLYKGSPEDLQLTAERVSPFTAATTMPRLDQVLVVSTEPIVSREMAKEFGTPRAVLYTILSKSEDTSVDDAKRLVAKSVIWLCRHAWISPASTREPAPLFFANKLSRLVSATGVSLSPDRSAAPLFL